MTQKYYEQEVKKVYPDAYSIRVMTVYFIKEDSIGTISVLRYTEESAWESAYQQLKDNGKL